MQYEGETVAEAIERENNSFDLFGMSREDVSALLNSKHAVRVADLRAKKIIR